MSSAGIQRSPLGLSAILGVLAAIAAIGGSIYFAYLPPCEGQDCYEEIVTGYDPNAISKAASGQVAAAPAHTAPARVPTEPDAVHSPPAHPAAEQPAPVVAERPNVQIDVDRIAETTPPPAVHEDAPPVDSPDTPTADASGKTPGIEVVAKASSPAGVDLRALLAEPEKQDAVERPSSDASALRSGQANGAQAKAPASRISELRVAGQNAPASVPPAASLSSAARSTSEETVAAKDSQAAKKTAAPAVGGERAAEQIAKAAPPQGVISPFPPDAAAEALAKAEAEKEAAARATDVTGIWDLRNAVDTTTYFPYLGLRLGYRLRLQQDGDRIVGAGEKRTENGRLLPASQRSGIRVEGTVRGRTVTLRFTEDGHEGTSGGVMTWEMASDGSRMRGKFSSSAAKSSGVSQLERAPN